MKLVTIPHTVLSITLYLFYDPLILSEESDQKYNKSFHVFTKMSQVILEIVTVH